MKVLNTCSEKYPAHFSYTFDKEKGKEKILRQIKFLEREEEKFYRDFFPDCKGFEDFMLKLKEIKKNLISEDIRAIRKLKGDKIRRFLLVSQGTNQKTQLTTEGFSRIEIKLDSKIGQEIIDRIDEQLQFLKGAGSSNFKVVDVKTDRSVTIQVGLKVNELKAALNEVFHTHYKEKSSSIQWFKKNLLNRDDILSFYSGDQSLVWQPNTKLSSSSIYSHGKEKIEKMSLNQRKALEASILNDISGYLNLSKCSQNFQTSFMHVWNSLIKQSSIASVTWNGSVQNIVGAFGEIQAAVVNDFLLKEIGVKVTPKFQAKISDPFIKGQQLKADLTFFQDFGVQVKNYGTRAPEYQKVNVNIGLDKLASYDSMSGIVNGGLFDFLTNYFFNSTFAEVSKNEYNSLLEGLRECFAEIASLNVGLDPNGRKVQDTVTFYVFNGAYFVPGSKILSDYLDNQFKTEEIKITSAEKGESDDYFGPLDGQRNMPFLDYWKHPIGVNSGQLSPTNKNFSEYNRIKGSISVRASFFYSSFLGKPFRLF